ncbi:uncharacterized protein LOC144212507 [Stigmatopora nigra]
MQTLEDHTKVNFQSVLILKSNLQEMNRKMVERLFIKSVKLDGKKQDIEKTTYSLKNILLDCKEKGEEMHFKNKKLQIDMFKLQGVVSVMTKQSAEVDKKKRVIDGESERFKLDREVLVTRANEIDAEFKELVIEKKKLEKLRFEMHNLEDQLRNNSLSREIVYGSCKHLNDQNLERISKQSAKLEAKENHIQNTALYLKNLLASIKKGEEITFDKNKRIQKQSIQLRGLLSSIVKQRKHLDETKREVDAETQILQSRKNKLSVKETTLTAEKEKLEQRQYEMQTLEDHTKVNFQSVLILKSNLQEMNKKMVERLFIKSVKLDGKKQDIERTTYSLKNILLDCKEKGEEIHFKNKKLQIDMFKLQGVVSVMTKQSAEVDKKKRVIDGESERFKLDREVLVTRTNEIDAEFKELVIEKKKLEKLRFEMHNLEDQLRNNSLSREIVYQRCKHLKDQNLERISKKSAKLEAKENHVQNTALYLKNLLPSIKKGEEITFDKNKRIQKQSIQLQGLLSSIVKQRKHLDETKREVDAETQILQSRENKLNVKETTLTAEKEKLEQRQYEMQTLEDHTKVNFQSVLILKSNLQEMNKKMVERLFIKSVKLDDKKQDIEKTTYFLKNILLDCKEKGEEIHFKNKELQIDMFKLQGVVSVMTKQSAEVDKKKRVIDAGSERFKLDREKLVTRTNEIDAEFKGLVIEKKKLEKLRFEMHNLEDQLRNNSLSREIVYQRCKHLKDQNLERISKQSAKLEAKENHIQNTALFEMHNLEDQLKNISLLLESVKLRCRYLYGKNLGKSPKQSEKLEAKKKHIKNTALSFKDVLDDFQKIQDKIYRENALSWQTKPDVEETRLITEKEKIRELRSEIKALEDHSKTNIPSVQILKPNLQEINRRILGGTLQESVKIESKKHGLQKTRPSFWKLIQEERVDVNAASERIAKQRGKFLLRKNNTDMRQQIAIEEENMETLRFEMKLHFISDVMLLKTMKNDLKQMLEKLHGILKQKSFILETNKTGIQEIIAKFYNGTDLIHSTIKQFQSQMIQLQPLLSTMIEQRAELGEMRKYFDVASERFNNEQENVLSIKSINKEEHKLAIEKEKMVQKKFEMQVINYNEAKWIIEKYGDHDDITQFPQSEREYPPILSISDKVEKGHKERILIQPDSSIYIATISKKVWLRKIWKDTNMEKKAINKMKCTGHETKQHLDQQLKVVTNFIKTYWSHKQKLFVRKKTQLKDLVKLG